MSEFETEVEPGQEFTADEYEWDGAEEPAAAIEWLDEEEHAQLDRYLDQRELRVEGMVAPLHDYLRAHEERVLLAQGAERAQELLADLGDGVDGFDETAVRESANETLVSWMQQLAADGLRGLQYSPAAIDELLGAASVEELLAAVRVLGHDPGQLGEAALQAAARQHGPRLGPHATVASAMFGRMDAPAQRPSSGLGNRPHAVTSRFFGGGRS